MQSDRQEDFCPERQLHLHQECVWHTTQRDSFYMASLIKEQEEENVMAKVHREDTRHSHFPSQPSGSVFLQDCWWEGILET